MLAQLGSFQFSTDSAAFDQVKRKTRYRWAKQTRLGSSVAAQFVGAGEDTLTLAGVIYPEHKGGFEQLSMMRSLAAEGKALSLVFAYAGLASVMGRWCIVSVDEGQRYFHSNGAPRKQEFTLELLYYGDNL